MLSNLQTYYLQTMGIEPWVMRHSESQAQVTVVLDAKFSDANQQKLFYAMFRSIGLSEDMLNIVYDISSDSFKLHVSKIQPQVIIALGCHVEACHTTPVITMHHPSDLLKNPIIKKEAYAHLASVKAALSNF